MYDFSSIHTARQGRAPRTYLASNLTEALSLKSHQFQLVQSAFVSLHPEASRGLNLAGPFQQPEILHDSRNSHHFRSWDKGGWRLLFHASPAGHPCPIAASCRATSELGGKHNSSVSISNSNLAGFLLQDISLYLPTPLPLFRASHIWLVILAQGLV